MSLKISSSIKQVMLTFTNIAPYNRRLSQIIFKILFSKQSQSQHFSNFQNATQVC